MSFLKPAFALFAVLLVAVEINANRVRLETGETVCACTMNWDPVCATDGKTYSNLCDFECARDEANELGRSAISLRNGNGDCLR